MALFGPFFLQLSLQEKAQLARLTVATEETAIALKALVAKLNEPEPDDSQPALDQLVATLAQSNTALADEVAKILTATPKGA